MKESFLHLVWQQQLLKINKPFITSQTQALEIHKTGVLNYLQGPDFKNALIELETIKWAGNIEVHVKSSDWYAHQHQNDKNYSNVILHVVYEHDVDVFDLYGNEIPTFELKKYILDTVFLNYEVLMSKKQQWIFCEDVVKKIDVFKLNNWLERLYIERLERKVEDINTVFIDNKKDWEATLFLLLAKYFGGNLNGVIFQEAFTSVDFSIIRKETSNKNLNALLFGLLGMLEKNDVEDTYYIQLQKEYRYLQQKYKLSYKNRHSLNFYGCRPANFPTIRLAQFIALYEYNQTLFAVLIRAFVNKVDYKTILSIALDAYWQQHYNFDKP